MSRTRTGLTALLLAPVLLVAGCSAGDPDPVFEEPPASGASEASESPSTSPPSGPPEPQLPAAARGTDAAAAVAFVKHYWAMVNYAQATGDLAGLREISSDKCVACKAGLKYLEKVFADDGAISGGVSRVLDPQAVFARRNGTTYAVVEFRLRTTPQTVNFPAHARDKRYEGGTSAMRSRLSPATTGWVMDYWDVV